MNANYWDVTKTNQLLELYNSGMSVENIAFVLDRTPRSIAVKLGKEGVYKKEPTRLKKEEILNKICEKLSLPQNSLDSLKTATHEHLTVLLNALKWKT